MTEINKVKKIVYIVAFVLFSIAVTYFALGPVDLSEYTNVNDKGRNIIGFAIFFWLFDFVFKNINIKMKVFVLMIYNISLESIQYFIPYRDFSLYDILASFLGAMVYIGLKNFYKSFNNFSSFYKPHI